MATMQWCGAASRRMMTMMTKAAAGNEQRVSFSSVSPASMTSSGGAPILCGRGDKRTKRGKRFKGSYGNARPKREKKIERIKEKVEVPSSTPWPLPFKLI